MSLNSRSGQTIFWGIVAAGEAEKPGEDSKIQILKFKLNLPLGMGGSGRAMDGCGESAVVASLCRRTSMRASILARVKVHGRHYHHLKWGCNRLIFTPAGLLRSWPRFFWVFPAWRFALATDFFYSIMVALTECCCWSTLFGPVLVVSIAPAWGCSSVGRASRSQ